jgi:hypothetical protein
MGIIGINDLLHTALKQIVEALAIVELMDDVPLISPGKKIPDGFEHLVRE